MRGWALGALGAVSASGCPTLEIGNLTLFSPDGSDATIVTVVDRETTNGTAASFNAVDGNVGSARMTFPVEHRAFLFTEDLETDLDALFGAGVRGGSVLRLPITPNDGSTLDVDIAPFDSSKWHSARVYDAGRCSLLIGWQQGDGGIDDTLPGTPSMSALIAEAVDDAVLGQPNTVGMRRTSATRIWPILRYEGSLGNTDAIRVTASFHADEVHGPFPPPCMNVNFTIDFEFGVRRATGPIPYEVPDGCFDPGFRTLEPDPAFDHEGVFWHGEDDIVITGLRRECFFAGGIDSTIRTAIATEVPRAVRSAIRDALVFSADQFDAFGGEIVPCTCDSECAYSESAAFDPALVPRPRCLPDAMTGESVCMVQLEPDRVELRPDGWEIVIAEDEADAQFDFLGRQISLPGAVMCGPSRARWIGDLDPDVPVPVEDDLLWPILIPIPPP